MRYIRASLLVDSVAGWKLPCALPTGSGPASARRIRCWMTLDKDSAASAADASEVLVGWGAASVLAHRHVGPAERRKSVKVSIAAECLASMFALICLRNPPGARMHAEHSHGVILMHAWLPCPNPRIHVRFWPQGTSCLLELCATFGTCERSTYDISSN